MRAAVRPYHPVHGKQDVMHLIVICAIYLPQQGSVYDHVARC